MDTIKTGDVVKHTARDCTNEHSMYGTVTKFHTNGRFWVRWDSGQEFWYAMPQDFIIVKQKSSNYKNLVKLQEQLA